MPEKKKAVEKPAEPAKAPKAEPEKPGSFISVGGSLLRPSLIYYISGTKDEKDGGYKVAYENDVFVIDDKEKAKIEGILCGQLKDDGWISIGGFIINVNRIYYMTPNPDQGKEGMWVMSYSNEIFDITAAEKDEILRIALAVGKKQ